MLKLLSRLWRAIPILIALFLMLWSGLFFAYAPELPDTSKVWVDGGAPATIILASDGSEIARRGGSRSSPVRYQELPQHLIDAVVSIEDRRFFSHFGLDPLGLARAIWRNLTSGHIVEGGSTLTQQLAKNLYLTPKRTIERKIQEMFLAIWLETQLTKQEILTLYLNRVYFGVGAYGVENAARLYFDKSTSELSLAESAMLAGLLKAPSRLSPASNLDGARERASVVLSAMEANELLSSTDRIAALKNPARTTDRASGGTGAYFVDWVIDRLPDTLRQTDRSLTLQSTLDPEIQRRAEAIVAKRLSRKVNRGRQVALVVLDASGAVRAMVGGVDYRQSRFNRASLAKRQPASTFKPFVYLAGLETGLTPKTVIEDKPFSIDGWTPRNYRNRYAGAITLEDAMARSLNTVALRVQERVGREKIIETAQRFGLQAEFKPVPSLANGPFTVTPLNLAAAYVPMINGARRVEPFGRISVTTASGQRLLGSNRTLSRPIADTDVIEDMRRMLAKALREGTGKRARLNRVDAGGKTGTSQNSRDAWFVGFAGEYVAAVWVGNDDNSPMRNVMGSDLPSLIWGDLMWSVSTMTRITRAPAPTPRPANKPTGLFDLITIIADGAIDEAAEQINEGEIEKGSTEEKAREGAKGLFRWFLKGATSEGYDEPENLPDK